MNESGWQHLKSLLNLGTGKTIKHYVVAPDISTHHSYLLFFKKIKIKAEFDLKCLDLIAIFRK